ncbi:SOS response-associated peptidase family protein [Candidatus Sodalis endolongispinus]|uniref:Abasic site processing protein n=1 Tax=Candidatus Sodalis endolongispinus TaxID=2812662 RepID=A0ABS5Y9A9_9GAMM|nr:SOS response-associated peptidase family protein [Candidatus Sodalis endolongispinus]MBT9431538.1 SOS response-associated peptidase family protein [Candidatus Sodalis endolongispinus]
MCGRFAQYEARSDYLAALDSPLACHAAENRLPIGRYNISPGSRVLILNQRDTELHLEAVTWGYHPPWAREHHQPAMISTRALILADGWYEWRTCLRHVERKQLYLSRRARRPLFFTALGRFHSTAADAQDDSGFVLLTGPGERGPVDPRSRPPLALTDEGARQWLDPALDIDAATVLAETTALTSTAFAWHPVSSAVGNIYNDSPQLIKPINDPVV